MSIDTILLGMALLFGFYMAWNIGANDVANSMGTSVGSKVLTLRKAVLVAGILNFCGAVFLGSHVTNTVRNGMFNPQLFSNDMYILVYGMLAALLAAGTWLQLATYFGWPVSTTHSIVGAIVGFVIVSKGGSAVNWNQIVRIVASWGVSPVLSGTFSFILFTLIRKKIFQARDPYHASRRAAPVMVFFVFLVLTMVMLFKGLKNLKLDFSFTESFGLSVIIGFIAMCISLVLLIKNPAAGNPAMQKSADAESDQTKEIIGELARVPGLLDTISVNGDEMLKNRVDKIHSEVKDLLEDIKMGALSQYMRMQRQLSFQNTEKIFAKLQVLSACFVAFAIGANDVANAIGPVAAIFLTIREQAVSLTAPVPLWILTLGGTSIAIGLATWGYRVIYTVGEKITHLSPSRGFTAEFSTALTVVFASRAGLPISTTHTLVGAVLGVGFAQGMNSLNMRVVRDIISSWIITLPFSGLLAIIYYYILLAVFG